MSIDKRQYPRTPGNNQAAIAYIKKDGAPIMCTIADISEGGAGLTFVNIAEMPDTFWVEVKGDTDLRQCKVAWRAAPHRMGVQFVRIDLLHPPLEGEGRSLER